MKKKVSKIVEAYVSAVQQLQWDYPAGAKFSSKQEVFDLVAAGKTIQDFWTQSQVQFGTITGGLLGMSGYCSGSSRKAIRQGVIYALERAS